MVNRVLLLAAIVAAGIALFAAPGLTHDHGDGGGEGDGHGNGIRDRLDAIQNTLNGIANGSSQVACQGRQYYLTTASVDGGSALTACADGFHMANFYEIFNPSSLVYDTALGQTADDSGSGPVTGVTGWIRTGIISTPGGPSGVANCSAYSTNSASSSGSLVALISPWDFSIFSSFPVNPWSPATDLCSRTHPVWCVQN